MVLTQPAPNVDRHLFICSTRLRKRKLNVKPLPLLPEINTICPRKKSLEALVDYLMYGKVDTDFKLRYLLDAWVAAQHLNLGLSTMESFAQAFLQDLLRKDRHWEELYEKRHTLCRVSEAGETFEYLLRELNKRHPLSIGLRGTAEG